MTLEESTLEANLGLDLREYDRDHLDLDLCKREYDLL